MKTRTLLISAALLVGVAATPLLARGPGGRGGDAGMRRMPIERLAERLELSNDQVAALKQIDRRRVEQLAQIRARQEVLRYELQGLMAADTPDQGAVFAKIDELAVVRGEMMKVNFAARIETRQLLGDKADQLQRFMGRAPRGALGQRGPRWAPPAPEAPDAPDAPAPPMP